MTRKILLVEDDPNFRTVLAMALELQGYLVRQAASGQKALDLLSEEHPDLIISDLEMRGMDGRALCKYIRGDHLLSSIPFVILSAFIEPDEPGNLLDLPADRCLSKQVSISQLVQLIRELLDRFRRLAQESGSPSHVVDTSGGDSSKAQPEDIGRHSP